MLATSLILGCIIFWTLIIIATIQMGITGTLMVLGVMALVFGFMMILITYIGERDKKGRNKHE